MYYKFITRGAWRQKTIFCEFMLRKDYLYNNIADYNKPTQIQLYTECKRLRVVELKKYMGFKKIICAAILAGISSVSYASAQPDTVEIAAQIFKKVKVGPSFFDARIIDSVRLRRHKIWALLQKKNIQNKQLTQFTDEQHLNQQLNEVSVTPMPADKIVNNLGYVMEEYERTGNVQGQATVLNTYAVYYARKKDYNKSTAYFNQALELRQRTKDKAGQAQVLENLAAISKITGDHSKRLSYSNDLVDLNTGLHRPAEIADAYLGVAESNMNLGKYKDAEFNAIKKALAIYSRTGNKAGRLRAFETIAEIYQRQHRFSEAKWFYVQAQTLAAKLNNRVALVNSLCHLAELKNIMGDHEMALDDYREAELLAKNNNFNLKLVEIKGELGEVYTQMGNYLAAGDVLAEYDKLRADYLKAAVL